jgi:hypothetical protein
VAVPAEDAVVLIHRLELQGATLESFRPMSANVRPPTSVARGGV